MAHNLEPTNENVRRIAQYLARAEMAVSEEHTTRIGSEGTQIPTWLLYVSAAQRLWIEHCAVNDLMWDGTKLPKRT